MAHNKWNKCPNCGAILPHRIHEEYKNIVQFDANGYPSCEKHGAMNCVNKDRKLWRCITCGIGVSFTSVESFDEWVRIHKERTNLGIESEH